MTLEYIVPAGEHGITVLSVLRRRMLLSASLVRRLKSAQGIFVDGETRYTNYVLSEGERVHIDLSGIEEPCSIVPEKGDLDIIYEDDHFLAVNKPYGVLTHPSRAKYTGTLANFAAEYIFSGGGAACHAVNRLDRDTSGVVLFAKSAHMKDLASKALKNENSCKEYYAAVFSAPTPESGKWDGPIMRKEPQNMLRIISPDGQPALTHYSTAASDGEISILRLRIMTGRTHQIRVHSLAAGCPVLGDTLYYTDASRAVSERLSLSAQCLHAFRLDFEHPLTGKMINLRAPITRDDMIFAAKNINYKFDY